MNLITFLHNASFFQITIIALVINSLLYISSITLYILITKFFAKISIQNEKQPILKKDILLSLIIIFVNSAVFILGVYLWKKNDIILNENIKWYIVILETVALILCMDFLMYCFHSLVYFPKFFPLIHRRHHLHTSTNALSLFVLHPLEAFGFGFLFILVIYMHSFSAISISIYLILNLLWGTIGHLNVEVFPSFISRTKSLNILGTAEFHNLHHQFPNYNLGFYTILWDRLFGTLAPFSASEVKENNGFYFPPALKIFIQELKENSEKFGTNEFEYYSETWIWDSETTVTFNGQQAEFTDWNFNNETFLLLTKAQILECVKEYSYEDQTSKYRLIK